MFTSSSNRHICQDWAQVKHARQWNGFDGKFSASFLHKLREWAFQSGFWWQREEILSRPPPGKRFTEKNVKLHLHLLRKNFAPKFWFQQQIQNFAHIYRTSRKNLLCIFRVRKCRSEKWHRLHLQLRSKQKMCNPNIWRDAAFCPRNNNSRNVIHIISGNICPRNVVNSSFHSDCYWFLSKVRAMLPISPISWIVLKSHTNPVWEEQCFNQISKEHYSESLREIYIYLKAKTKVNMFAFREHLPWLSKWRVSILSRVAL